MDNCRGRKDVLSDRAKFSGLVEVLRLVDVSGSHDTIGILSKTCELKV